MRGGHDYARTINPTRTALEACLASLEGGRARRRFSSGMGATTRDHGARSRRAPRTVAINDVYGGTYRLFSKMLEPKGYGFEYADLTDEGVAQQALEQPADLVWIETPTNPLLKVVDIRGRRRARARRRRAARGRQHLREPVPAAAARARRRHRRALDHQVHRRPLRRRSAASSLTNDPAIAERLHFLQNAIGAVPGPLDCFLTLRGAKTLAVRMERHCENAGRIARWLTRVAGRRRGLLPGPRVHPGHETAAPADARLRRHGLVPRARRPRRRRRGAAGRPASGRSARASAASRAWSSTPAR